MVEEVTPEEVRDAAEADDVTVVDIRSRAQYERGHVPGAINLPLNELPSRVDDVEWDEEVVCVCAIGESSIQAARLLSSYEGVEAAKSMAGGYREWEYDLEREGSEDPDDPSDADAPF